MAPAQLEKVTKVYLEMTPLERKGEAFTVALKNMGIKVQEFYTDLTEALEASPTKIKVGEEEIATLYKDLQRLQGNQAILKKISPSIREKMGITASYPVLASLGVEV